jgi:hypothetical protein
MPEREERSRARTYIATPMSRKVIGKKKWAYVPQSMFLTRKRKRFLNECMLMAWASEGRRSGRTLLA